MRTLSRPLILMLVILIVAAIGIWLVLAARQSGSQTEPPPSAPDPQGAAEQGLQTFQQIVTADNYQALGFETPDEIKTAQLGQPLQVLRVPLDQLLAFSPESDPEKLLVDENRVIYPVTVNEQVRSSIGIEGNEKEWYATDFGNSSLVRALTQFQQAPSDFVVQVPALNLYFIARHSENGLLLTPIMDDTRFDFKSGETLNAAAAFEAMLPVAKDYNGLPS